jgi:hypothetical protein
MPVPLQDADDGALPLYDAFAARDVVAGEYEMVKDRRS